MTGWIVATAATITALALAAWILLRPTTLPAVTRFQIFAPPGSTLPLGTPAPSPDGRMLAYTVQDHDGLVRLYVRSLDSTEARALSGTENALHPFWSPDGRSLAFAAGGEIKRIDLTGGSGRNLTSTGAPWHGSWSPSGVILFVDSSGIVQQIPAEGGVATPALKLDEKKGETSSGFPFSLPDGKSFLFNMGLSDGSRGIELASLGSMNRKLVLRGVTSAPILAPAPNGKTYLLYLREASLTAQEFDEKSATVRGSPVLLLDGIGRVSATVTLPSVGVSQNGVLAYQTGVEAQASRLGWFNRSGKSLKELPPSAGALDPRFSPDGRFVAMRKRSGAGSDIWLMDLTRGSSTRFTFGSNGTNHLGLIWSPDGKRIAYGLAGGGMYTKDPNGMGAEQRLLNSFGRPLSWSPDGRQILFEALGGRLFLIPLEGGKAPVPIGPAAGASGADISPDGKYFAVTSGESGRDEVYIEAMPPGTGKWQISINGGGQPRWRKDGKELFFLSLDLKMMAVDIQSGQGIAAGVPHVLFQTGALSFASPDYDVSSDGQSFLIALPASNAVDAPITVVLNWWAGLKSGGDVE